MVWNGATYVPGGAYITEFAEEYYPKLRLAEDTDGFGRPANVWTYDGKEVGTYNDAEDLKYVGYVTLGQIYKDLGLTGGTNVTVSKDATFATTATGAAGESTYYIDGIRQDDPDHNATANALRLTKEDSTQIGGLGTETYVYYYSDGSVRICEVNWYVGDVTGVYAATATRDAYIDIASRGIAKQSALRNGDAVANGAADNLAASAYNELPSGTKKTTAFSIDDVVLYTVSWAKSGSTANVTNSAGTNSPSIKDVVKAETATGSLTSYTTLGGDGLGNTRASGSITVDGTKYSFSNKLSNHPSTAMINTGSTVEVVFDKSGNVIDVDDSGVQDYAVVVKHGTSGGGTYNSNDTLVDLLLTDGTATKTVTLNSDNHTTVDRYTDGVTAIATGDIVTFTVNSSGKYTLTLKSAAQTYTNPAAQEDLVSSGSSKMTNQLALGATNKGRTANGKTVFLIKDTSGNYKAYAGAANVPTIESGIAGRTFTINSFADTQDAAARIAYFDLSGGNATIKTGETIFVAIKTSDRVTVDSVNGNYYEFGAYVNGEPTALKVEEDQGRALTGEFPNGGYAMYETVSYSNKNIATLGSRIYPVATANSEKNDVIGLGGVFYSYAKDVKVFYINENNEIVPSSIKGIPTSNTIASWFNQNSADDVSYVFWTKSAVTELASTATIAQVRTAFGTGKPIVYIDGNWTPSDAATGATTQIPAGTAIIVNGTFTLNTGANYAAGNAATLDVRGTIDAAKVVVDQGFLSVGQYGTVRSASNIRINAGGHAEFTTGATLNAVGDNATNVINGSSLVISGGEANFAGNVLVLGKLTVTGGEFNVAGTTGTVGSALATALAADPEVTAAGVASETNAVITISGGNVTIDDLSLANGDTVTISGAANVIMDEVTTNSGSANITNTSSGSVKATSTDSNTTANTVTTAKDPTLTLSFSNPAPSVRVAVTEADGKASTRITASVYSVDADTKTVTITVTPSGSVDLSSAEANYKINAEGWAQTPTSATKETETGVVTLTVGTSQ